MKKFAILLLLTSSILLFTKCKKEEIKTEDAQIVGIDFRRCVHPVCGGYWIEIAQDTLRFFDFPENSNFEVPNTDKEFPIEVAIKWKWADDEDLQLAGDLIIIEYIEKK